MMQGLFAVKAVAACSAVLLMAGAIVAGDIKGKVSVQGLKSAENIAVYVDAIPDKKFDAPTAKPVVDQTKMTFVPHVIVVQVGTTVEFLNSDPVGHNVYWPSISGNKKLSHNLGTWPKGEKKRLRVQQCRCGQPALQRAPRNERLHRCRPHTVFRLDR